MIIDTRLKTAFGDPKPEKVCNWKECPNEGNFKGLQVKKCSKCTWVRYCCRDCQVADWPEHKAVCRPPHMIDIRAWMERYAWLFRWAARESLCPSRMNLTATHVLVVDVIRTDRLVEATPLAFLVDSVYVLPHGTVEKHWGVTQYLYEARDRAQCMQIQARGGLGLAQVLHRIPGPNDTSMFFPQRFELAEPRPDAHAELSRQEVYALTKKVANHELPPDAVRTFLTKDDCQAEPDKPQGPVTVLPAGKPRRKVKPKRKQPEMVDVFGTLGAQRSISAA